MLGGQVSSVILQTKFDSGASTGCNDIFFSAYPFWGCVEQVRTQTRLLLPVFCLLSVQALLPPVARTPRSADSTGHPLSESMEHNIGLKYGMSTMPSYRLQISYSLCKYPAKPAVSNCQPELVKAAITWMDKSRQFHDTINRKMPLFSRQYPPVAHFFRYWYISVSGDRA